MSDNIFFQIFIFYKIVEKYNARLFVKWNNEFFVLDRDWKKKHEKLLKNRKLNILLRQKWLILKKKPKYNEEKNTEK